MTITIIAVLICLLIVQRERNRRRLSEAELRRFREYLCKGDLVRLPDGRRAVVGRTTQTTVELTTEQGTVVVSKNCV